MWKWAPDSFEITMGSVRHTKEVFMRSAAHHKGSRLQAVAR